MNYYKITFPFKTNIPMLVEPSYDVGSRKDQDFFIVKNLHNRVTLWYKPRPIDLVIRNFKRYHHPNLWNDDNIVILDKLKEEKINKMSDVALNNLGLFRITNDFADSEADLDRINKDGKIINTIKLNKIVEYLVNNDPRIPKVFDENNYNYFTNI